MRFYSRRNVVEVTVRTPDSFRIQLSVAGVYVGRAEYAEGRPHAVLNR